MKFKALFLAVGLMAFAGLSHAQFQVWLFNETFQLTNSCDGGGTPLPPSCNGVIYWDSNANGPDDADAPVPALADPNDPPVFGYANFNTFPLNGWEYGAPDGFFYCNLNFVISTNTPQPSRYYVRVDCQGVRWTSSVFIVNDGYQEFELTQWTCATTQVPCDPHDYYIPTDGGRFFAPYWQCLYFCAGTPSRICLGPLAADERPHAVFLPGCLGNGCDVECPPTQVIPDPAGWTYNAATGQWCITVVAPQEGCACFFLDYIESAEQGSFAAVARDNSVELNWSTNAESNVDRFEVLRKIAGHESFTTVGAVSATNSSAGSTYTFVDNGAVNGTTYEYTLTTVNLDGSHEAWGLVVTATPSSDAAVITEYALHQNYPNPFNPSTNLVYDVVAENVVSLKVYNAMGQEVATLVNGLQSAGRHTVSFDASNLTSGLYFYTVKIGNEFASTKKMLLVK